MEGIELIQDIPCIPFNYGGITGSYSDLESSRFVIIPVPYDLTTSYLSGTRKGPYAVIEASTHLELYDEELGIETFLAGIHTLPFIEPVTSSPEAMVERVAEVCRAMLDKGKVPVMIGGEHSLTIGMVKSLKSCYPDLSVIQLDAHADMRDSYEGSRYNHACVGRRVFETSYLKQIGIRSLSREEAEYIESSKVDVVYADDLHSISDEDILNGLKDHVYISIDLDVLDPSIMPSVGTPEPGGLKWEDLLRIVRLVAETRHVVGFDVVELSPIPGFVSPDYLAAKLIYRSIGYIYTSSRDLRSKG